MNFTVLNWNIGGAKYLELEENKRSEFRKQLNGQLQKLIEKHRPHVVTLQEIVRYGASNQSAKDIVDPIKGYRYYSFPLIDTDRLSSEAKWNKVKTAGVWSPDTYFAQGNAMLFRNNVPHFPVWSLPAKSRGFDRRRHFVEQVNIESGLYFGDRNTEPRAALVAHFVFTRNVPERKPLDIFVVNLHLTTLMNERDGIPEIDTAASRIRMAQIDTIFNGIVSRYNLWRQQDYTERLKPRPMKDGENYKRLPPVWILTGDFNFTPESVEYETIRRMNFIDVIYSKGTGSKSKGIDRPATLTVDYIFAGPQFISLDPFIFTDAIKRNGPPDYTVKVSDHYPMFATIPLAIPVTKE
ncbi:endonuclease/exonuclease/phosphatase family protein [Chloroflexota bacterium]